MDPIALVGPARNNPVQEYDLVIPLLDRHVPIANARQRPLQLDQLVVVGRKQGARTIAIVQLLDDRPSQAQAIVGARAATDLVEDHQRSLGGGIEDPGRLDHLDHERTLTLGQFVAGSDPRKELIGNPDGRFASRYKTPYLSQYQNGRALTNIGALASHVRTGDQLNPPMLGPNHAVVGHELTLGHDAIEHRMTAFVDLQDRLLGDRRTNVTVLDGQLR